MFRVGVLYRTQEFLQLIYTTKLTVADFHRSFPKYNQIKSKDILRTALCSRWIILYDDLIQLTATGLAVVKQNDPSMKLRLQLRDLLQFAPPPWVGLLHQGRKALIRYGNLDTIQCFQDAGLLDEVSPEVASWWDGIAHSSRQLNEARLLEIGRKGEWLSIEYEERRIGRRPEWTALENTATGYDLLSKVSQTNSEHLIIEVKTSEEPWSQATFFLSRNEWFVLSSHRHATIHLWSLAYTPPLFFELSINTLKGHIPSDQGEGKWQQVNIPFQIGKCNSTC